MIFRFHPSTSENCVEANFFTFGPELIDGIFFDTGSMRGRLAFDLETEERDLQSHIQLSTFTKNLWRDHVLGLSNINMKALEMCSLLENFLIFKMKDILDGFNKKRCIF